MDKSGREAKKIVDGENFENGISLHFQIKTDTCGQGL